MTKILRRWLRRTIRRTPRSRSQALAGW